MDLAPGEKVVAMLYVGYPAGEREMTGRAPASDKTMWLGWD
jgi:hypothetical protein